MSEVNNLKEFLLKQEDVGRKTVSRSSEKASTYKYTTCGAWIEVNKEGISVGSIVEGCDEGTETHELKYPGSIWKFWSALEDVDQAGGSDMECYTWVRLLRHSV